MVDDIQGVLSGLSKIGKIANDFEQLKKEAEEKRLEIAQLERNINLLKKNRQEELEMFNKEKQETNNKINELKRIITDLQAQRDSVRANILPEVAQLNFLKEQINRDNIALDKKIENLNEQSKQLNQEQIKLEEKKKLLEQIIELTKQL